jgi:1,4-dihydroxy-2-naphthoyl-CoA synthase
MNEILTERSGSILRIQLNRPEKKNAVTSDMYVTLAELLGSDTSVPVSCFSWDCLSAPLGLRNLVW